MKPYYEDLKSGIVIYHGDCREILPTLGTFDLCLTDPPYGIGFASQPTNYQRSSGMKPKSWDDERVILPVLNARDIIIWGGNYFELPISRGWIVWIKRDAPPSMGNVEMAWTNQDKNSRFIDCTISSTNAERIGHPTQKPLRVMLFSILQCNNPKTIIDPFMGSGTTLRAAKDLGRQCVGIEMEEKYCEIAATRLQQEILL